MELGCRYLTKRDKKRKSSDDAGSKKSKKAREEEESEEEDDDDVDLPVEEDAPELSSESLMAMPEEMTAPKDEQAEMLGAMVEEEPENEL